jgi:hypothetical protein
MASPSTATMRLMNTSSLNRERGLPRLGWKMMTSPAEGSLGGAGGGLGGGSRGSRGAEGAGVRSWQRRAARGQQLPWGPQAPPGFASRRWAGASRSPGWPASRGGARPPAQRGAPGAAAARGAARRSCGCSQSRRPGSRLRPPPEEAVGQLLCDQPVAYVKGGEHGERGDEARLGDEPGRGRAGAVCGCGVGWGRGGQGGKGGWACMAAEWQPLASALASGSLSADQQPPRPGLCDPHGPNDPATHPELRQRLRRRQAAHQRMP